MDLWSFSAGALPGMSLGLASKASGTWASAGGHIQLELQDRQLENMRKVFGKDAPPISQEAAVSVSCQRSAGHPPAADLQER